MENKDSFLIKGTYIISEQTEGINDILVENGFIEKISKEINVEGNIPTYDMENTCLVPGLMDMHVHLREPGREDKETIVSGSSAAVKGGFTDIVCMPNTTPVNDNANTTRYIYDRAKEAHCCVYAVGAITKASKGKEISEMFDLCKEGVIAFSDDGACIMDSMVMRKAMEYSKIFNKPLITHSEDINLTRDGVINEGMVSLKTNLKGIPSISEDIMVYRDIALSEYLDVPLHIAHVSTARSLRIIEDAKARGVKVTCEVTPHHLSLTEDELLKLNTNTKINPPLRTLKDVDSLRQGLKNNIIDVIASDHAPHTLAEKELNLSADVPCGTIGLETSLLVVLKDLYHTGILKLSDIVQKMCYNPNKILGLDPPAIRVGSKAKFSVFNTEDNIFIDKGFFLSKSNNSAFIGKELKGKVLLTVVNGSVKYFNGKLV